MHDEKHNFQLEAKETDVSAICWLRLIALSSIEQRPDDGSVHQYTSYHFIKSKRHDRASERASERRSQEAKDVTKIKQTAVAEQT